MWMHTKAARVGVAVVVREVIVLLSAMVAVEHTKAIHGHVHISERVMKGAVHISERVMKGAGPRKA